MHCKLILLFFNFNFFLTSGPRYVVNIGEKVVDYNTKFKLFLVSKYSEIELPPNFYAVVSTINFSTTKAGLTGQVMIFPPCFLLFLLYVLY